MNLMNIRAKCWSWELLQVTSAKIPLSVLIPTRYKTVVHNGADTKNVLNARSLGSEAEDLWLKLGGDGGVIHSHSICGNIAEYFVGKYGFSRDCKVVAGSGDNPSSLVGLRGTVPGDVILRFT